MTCFNVQRAAGLLCELHMPLSEVSSSIIWSSRCPLWLWLIIDEGWVRVEICWLSVEILLIGRLLRKLLFSLFLSRTIAFRFGSWLYGAFGRSYRSAVQSGMLLLNKNPQPNLPYSHFTSLCTIPAKSIFVPCFPMTSVPYAWRSLSNMALIPDQLGYKWRVSGGIEYIFVTTVSSGG